MPKGTSKEMVGQHQDLICSENKYVELEDLVDLLKANPPQENVDPEDGGLTLLGFSQIYDPAYEVNDANDGIPILTATSTKIKKITEDITKKESLTELSDTLHLPTSMEAFMQSMKSNGTTFMNCTFNFK